MHRLLALFLHCVCMPRCVCAYLCVCVCLCVYMYICVFLCMCLCVCASVCVSMRALCTCHSACLEVREQIVGFPVSFHHLGFCDQTQVIRLDSKQRHLPSHLVILHNDNVSFLKGKKTNIYWDIKQNTRGVCVQS